MPSAGTATTTLVLAGAVTGALILAVTSFTSTSSSRRRRSCPFLSGLRRYRRRRSTPASGAAALEMDFATEDARAQEVLEAPAQEGPTTLGNGDTVQLTESALVETDESGALLGLLYNIATDQARKEGHVHRSITCNHCGTSPIRGYRFKCANCVDYDLCEQCEALEIHPKTHCFLKIRIPIPPLANPRSALLGLFYPGREVAPTPLSWDKLRDLQSRTHFDQVELESFYDQYLSLSTVPEGITRETFEHCLGPLGLEKNLITDRIFAFFDQDHDSIISFEELVCGLSILCKGSLNERIKYAFRGYDLNGDGYISRNELHKMFKAYFHLSMELVRDVVKTMEEGLMESFDDEAAKPVSASFTAPIPSSHTNNRTDDNDSATSEKKQKMKEKENEVLQESPSSQTIPTLRHPQTRGASTSSGSRPTSANRPSPTDAIRLLGHSDRLKPLSPRLTTNNPLSPLTPLSPSLSSPEEEPFPLMETMSQEAIVEMVDRVFKEAGCAEKDKMDLDEFRDAVEKDMNLLAWFEALGSVF